VGPLTVVELPQSMSVLCGSAVPGSLNETETCAVALPPDSPMGPVGAVTEVMTGSTFATVTVTVRSAEPPAPSLTCTVKV